MRCDALLSKLKKGQWLCPNSAEWKVAYKGGYLHYCRAHKARRAGDFRGKWHKV